MVFSASRQTALGFSLAASLVSAMPGAADTIYFTDFENHSAGANNWEGTDSWVGNSTTSGSHGIDQDKISSALGRTAYLGGIAPTGISPATQPAFVARPVSYDPATDGPPIIEVETLLGISDSTGVLRDDFWLRIYNNSLQPFAGIRFSNQTASFGIWVSDGVTQTDTAVTFSRGEIHLLVLRIDLDRNRWTVLIDGAPLFSNTDIFSGVTIPFTATGLTRSLGYVGFEWRCGTGALGLWGDNWLLVADLEVRTVPFTINHPTFNGLGQPLVKWTADAAYDYQLQHTDSLSGWQNTAAFPGITQRQSIEYTDTSGAGVRCYRVTRTPSP